MGKYDTRLSALTQAEVNARLEGHAGLLALTGRELFFIDDQTQQSARLSGIRRITINKETGNVEVLGDQGPLMTIPPVAFQKDELKLFLESLKGHVLKAKSQPTQVKEAREAGPVAAPAAPPEPEPVLAAPEPAAPRFSEPEPAVPRDPTPAPVGITEPPRTLPDEPSDSIWAYEGGAKPADAARRTAELPAPAFTGEPTLPPTPVTEAIAAPVTGTRRTGFVLLKIWALVTLVFALAYMFLNLTSVDSTVDPLVSVGVLVGGVALALIQWRLSEPL